MSNSPALLQVDIKHRQGPLAIEVGFALTEPWTVLFGSSGSGKTTILRTIMGFVRPDVGKIVLGSGQVLVDRTARLFVPPHWRGVRSAGQSARLFPGKTVRQNVTFGTGWSSKPDEARNLVDEVLQLFRIDTLAEKMPEALSGGEQQRVSVARAVASAVTNSGALLLLDEPFTGLDFALRDELMLELQTWLREWKTPVLSVTHDVGEAFLLDAEVIRMAEGRVVEQGPVEQVLARERERLRGQLRG